MAVRLRPIAEAPPAARRLIRRRLAHLAAASQAARAPEASWIGDDVAAVAGALVTVSVCQSRSPLTLRLLVDEAAAVVEVEDACDEFPQLAARGDAAATRLLEQVSQASLAWGYRKLARGRQLWARVAIEHMARVPARANAPDTGFGQSADATGTSQR